MIFKKNSQKKIIPADNTYQGFSDLLNKISDEITFESSTEDKKRWYDIYNSMYGITEKEFALVKKNIDVVGGLQNAWRKFKIDHAEKAAFFKDLEDLKNNITEILLGFDRGVEGYGNERLKDFCMRIKDEVGKCNREQNRVDADMREANEIIREKEKQLYDLSDSDDEILIEDINADLNELEDQKADYQNQINQIKIKKSNLLALHNWIRRIVPQKSKERLEAIAKKISDYDISDPKQVLTVAEILKEQDNPITDGVARGDEIKRVRRTGEETRRPLDPRSEQRMKKIREMKEQERSSVASTIEEFPDMRENNKNN